MEPNSPMSRMERTMWTVWGYISGAVTRFLRSQPAEVTNNEPSPPKDSTVESESSKSDRAQVSTSVGRVSEERPLPSAHLPKSSSPGVAWEICTTEIDLGSDEEGQQLRKGNEGREPENVDGRRQEQSGQTGKDNAGLQVTDDAKENEDAAGKTESGTFSTCGRGETPEINEKRESAGLGRLTEAVTEGRDKSYREDGAEVRPVSAVKLDCHQKLHETMADIQVMEDEGEKDEEDLEEEDSEVKPCTFTDLRPEEKGCMFRGEAEVQKLSQEEAKTCQDVLKPASENESKPDEGRKPAENLPSDCGEMPHVSKDEFIVAGHDVRGENNEGERVSVVIIKEQDISDEEKKKDKVTNEEGKEDIDEEVKKNVDDDKAEEEQGKEDIDDDDDYEKERAEKNINDDSEEQQQVKEDIDDDEDDEEQQVKEYIDDDDDDDDDEQQQVEEDDDDDDEEQQQIKEDIDDDEDDDEEQQQVKEDIDDDEEQQVKENIDDEENDEEQQLEKDDDNEKERVEEHINDDVEKEQQVKEDIDDEEQQQQKVKADIYDGDNDEKERVEEHINDDVEEEQQVKENIDDEEDDEKQQQLEADIDDDDEEQKQVRKNIDDKEEEQVEEDDDDEKRVDELINDDVEEEQQQVDEDNVNGEDVQQKQEKDIEEEKEQHQQQVEEDIDDDDEEQQQQAEEDINDDDDDNEEEKEQHQEVEEDLDDIVTDDYEVEEQEEREEDVEETTKNSAVEEEPEPERSSRVFPQVWGEENILTRSDEAEENTPHHKSDITDKQADLEAIGEPAAAATDSGETSKGEKLADKDRVEEEKLSSQGDNKGGGMENVCTTASVTVNPQGETEQEISGEFKNIPLRFTEGQIAVSQELDAEVCGEAREGIPEYNNQLGPDENTTQWFLERGNCEEIQITQLPEEEESEDEERFKNKGAGGHCLILGERLEENQDCAEESDPAVVELSEEESPAVAETQESGRSSEEREVELSQSSMKTEIKLLDEEFEARVGTDDFKEAAGDVQETNEEVRFAEAEKMREVRFSQVSVYPTHTGQSRSRTPGQPEEIQDMGIDVDKLDYAEAEKEAEMQDRDETSHLLGAGSESELSQLAHTQEMINQSPFGAFQKNETEINDTEAADEPKTNDPEVLPEETKHVTQSEEIYRKEASSLIREHQDVTDEEILDLWIETVMSEDTPEQNFPAIEPQTDTLADPLTGEPDKSGKEKLNSGESEFVSNTETPPSALRSGYLDQSFSETERLNFTSTGSPQGVHDMLATESELSASTSESQAVQMEEAAERSQSYLEEEEKVSETEAKRPDQEPEESVEKPDERSEAEMEVAVIACRDTEKADLMSQIKMSPLFQVKVKNFEDESLEATVSESSNEIKPAESGLCKGDSEASLEESPDAKPWTEPEMKMLSEEVRPEDAAGSSPEPSGPEVVEEQETKPSDQNEVDSPALDFTMQRSRIAVKNPHIRPPTNARFLLHMPSADPTPPSHVKVKVPAGVPLGGLGIGIKLPGLGAGFPVLKKTQRVIKNEDSQEAHSQEPAKKEEEKSSPPKQDEAQHKPRWMPPGNPGFGNPLMSELKSKLKKTPKE